MQDVLNDHAPSMRPAIFPRRFVPLSLESLCSNERQAQRLLKKWSTLRPGSDPGRVIFRTVVDIMRREVRVVGVDTAHDEVESLLSSLERSMELQVSGDEAQVNLAVSRFLTLNGHKEGDAAAQRYRFTEAYQVAYAMKVLISNMPVKVLWGSKGQVQLPFDANLDNFDDIVGSLLMTSKSRKSKPKENDSDSDSDSDSDNDESNTTTLADSKAKRKKKKRRSAGSGKKSKIA